MDILNTLRLRTAPISVLISPGVDFDLLDVFEVGVAGGEGQLMLSGEGGYPYIVFRNGGLPVRRNWRRMTA